MVRVIDRISDWFGILAAWIFFATGAILTYEVVSRYLFNAPTVWVEEVSQLLLIAGVYLAVSRTVHLRENIRIDALYGHLGPNMKKIADTFALLGIVAFAAMVLIYGSEIAADSFIVGRTTGSIINIPSWWTQGLIPFGFGLVFLQAIIQLIRVWAGDAWGTGNIETETGTPANGGNH